MKFVNSILAIGIASGLLMGCATNKNGTTRNNVSPVRYNPNTNPNYNNNMDRVSYNDNLGPGANVNYRNNNNVGTDVNNPNNVNNNYRNADDIADKVANLNEVNRANVLVTGNNAYVAVMLNDRSRNELPRTVKNKIIRTVKKADNRIDNVYVSVNPDFFDRMTDYGNQIRSGHPVRGLFDQIGGTIKRVFPTR